MALEEKDVRYVAELAHLELTPDEVNKFLPQLDSILQHIQKLNELDTSQVEPMAQVTYPAAANPSLRGDQPKKTFDQDEALANAPDPSAGFFRIPRVIEKEE
jgi:aspartyl-tRNA(Asn)/glutamyl-tRNA(Gln) amidotransferase subunit C